MGTQLSLIKIVKAGRQDEQKREQLMEQLRMAQEENTSLKASLKQYEELDPDELEKLREESQVTEILVNYAMGALFTFVILRFHWKL